MSSKKSLNLELDFFLDISQQIAYKRYIHKKFWNVVLHCITSAIIVWSAFLFTSCFLPYFINHLLLVVVLLVCLKQDVLLGLAVCIMYPVIYYHALYVSNCSLFSAVLGLASAQLAQHHIGQERIEDTNVLNFIEKSTDLTFSYIDMLNEIFLCFFHNFGVLVIRLDRRRDLFDSSNIILRRFLDRTKKVP